MTLRCVLVLTGSPVSGLEPRTSFHPFAFQFLTRSQAMSEEAQAARQALQESMDLRDQGHTDD